MGGLPGAIGDLSACGSLAFFPCPYHVLSSNSHPLTHTPLCFESTHHLSASKSQYCPPFSYPTWCGIILPFKILIQDLSCVVELSGLQPYLTNNHLSFWFMVWVDHFYTILQPSVYGCMLYVVWCAALVRLTQHNTILEVVDLGALWKCVIQ